MQTPAYTDNNTQDLLRQISVAVAYLVMVVVNALANILPINGRTTAQVSDTFDVFFVPAGYVFSIWGLIYLALLAFTIYQALPTQRANPALRRIGWLFVLSCAANTIWIFMWHYGLIPLTLVLMLTLLASLIAVYVVLDIGRTPVPAGERWLVHLPFSIYLGWITVATIANATDLLYYLNWDGWGIGAQTWAVIMLAVGIVLGLLMAALRRDVAFLLVLVWAFAGIAVKQSDGDAPMVAVAAGVASAFVALLAILTILLPRINPRTPHPGPNQA